MQRIKKEKKKTYKNNRVCKSFLNKGRLQQIAGYRSHCRVQTVCQFPLETQNLYPPGSALGRVAIRDDYVTVT